MSSSLFGPLDLRMLQSAANALMPSTAVIWRRTYGDDTVGGGTLTFTAAGTVACLAQPESQSPYTGDSAGRDTETEAWILSLPAYTDVRSTDYVVVSGLGTLDIQSVRGYRSYEASRRITCTKR